MSKPVRNNSAGGRDRNRDRSRSRDRNRDRLVGGIKIFCVILLVDPGLGLEEGEGDLQVTDLIQEEEIEMEDGREVVGISVFCLIDLFAWKIISCYVNEQITN